VHLLLKNITMITITLEEITEFRNQFAPNPEALAALDAIELCKGNLEAATQLIAFDKTKKEVSLKGDSLSLDKLAHKLQEIICQEEFEELMTGVLTTAIAVLATSGNIPVALATPVVIYVAKIGVKKFCKVSSPVGISLHKEIT
jgi:hypothetical protein